MAWNNTSSIGPKGYKCGYCELEVGSNVGWFSSNSKEFVFICPRCAAPTFFDGNDEQHPMAKNGAKVESLPRDVEALYEEARNCSSVAAHTAVVLACRKILMNVAVAHKAKEGLSFIDYVNHLELAGFIPPNGKEWVDHIRKKGNEATHEIKVMDRATAADLLTFTEMLLRFAFEFPNRVPKPKQ